MFAVVAVCKKLWRIGIQLLDVDMHLFLSKTHPCLQTEDWQALVLRMLAFARYIKLIVKSDKSGQLRAQEILRSLSLAQRPLKALLFDDGMCPKDDPSTDEELTVSTLSSSSWPYLVTMMKSPVMTSKLEDVKFPEYDAKTISKSVQKKLDPTVHLSLFDSNIEVEFKSVEPQPRQIKIAAKGRPATIYSPANGSCVEAVRSLIKNCKPGPDLKLLVMIGTTWSSLVSLIYQYRNQLAQMGLANPQKLANLTSLELRNYNCDCLPKDLFRSINLSSVKELTAVQCFNLRTLWELFLTSRSPISITKLTINIHDWSEYLMEGHAYGFEAFCKAFGTLTHLYVKVCEPWSLDIDALNKHTHLRAADLDLGKTLPLEDLQKLQLNHPELQELHYRDHELASPLGAGKWHNDFKEKISGTAAALANMTELMYLRIIAHPQTYWKQRFNDVETDKVSVEQILATRIYESISAAANDGGVVCRVGTIVITEQPILVFKAWIKEHGLCRSTVFEFPLKKEAA